jgi:hypothetical protein
MLPAAGALAAERNHSRPGLQAAQRSLNLASSQYREGFADFQRVLDAQQLLLQQQDGYLVSRGNAVSSLVTLYKAWAVAGTPAARRSTRPPASTCSNAPTGANCSTSQPPPHMHKVKPNERRTPRRPVSP